MQGPQQKCIANEVKFPSGTGPPHAGQSSPFRAALKEAVAFLCAPRNPSGSFRAGGEALRTDCSMCHYVDYATGCQKVREMPLY